MSRRLSWTAEPPNSKKVFAIFFFKTRPHVFLGLRCVWGETKSDFWALFSFQTENNLIILFIALIHPIHWTIAIPVSTTGLAKRQKKTFCIYYRHKRSQSVHSSGVALYFLPVIVSFCLARGVCRHVSYRETFLKFYNKFENFNYLNVAFISYKLTMWD